MRTIRHEHIRDATSMVQDSKKGRGETAEMVRACDWRKSQESAEDIPGNWRDDDQRQDGRMPTNETWEVQD